MQLKRLYDKEAPAAEWLTVEEECQTCQGKGKVVNEAADGLADCAACSDGVRTRQVPPVAGVEVQRVGAVGTMQNFSPRLIEGGRAEGWLALAGNQVIITGVNKVLTYDIQRVPGRYEDGRINHYECVLVKEVEVQGG